MSSNFAGIAIKLVVFGALFVHESQGSFHTRLLRHHGLKEHTGQPQLPRNYEPPSALCIKDTGRHCEPYDKQSQAVLDAMSQCHSNGATNWSAPSPRVSRMSRTGQCDEATQRCVCKPGYCADIDQNCHEGFYDMLSTPFRITTKSFGEDMPLYMTEDGKVKMGDPPSQAAATWHISIAPSGVKHLVTGAFRDVVLEESEDCTEIVDAEGFPTRACLTVVGHSSEPRADSTGWRFEAHSDFVDDRSGEQRVYLQIKNVNTGKYIFVNPPPRKEAHMCAPGSANCPGDYGALRFDPPFPTDMIDPPPTLGNEAIETYMWSYALVVMLMLCIYCSYSNIEAKTSRFDDDVSWCLIIPLRELGRCIGLRNMI